MKLIAYTLYVIMVALGILIDKRVFYVLFMVMVLFHGGTVKKWKDFWLSVAIYSVILPDNYSTELAWLMFFIFGNVLTGKIRYKRKRGNVFVMSLFALAIFTTIVHAVPIINILFSIVSFAPLVAFLILMQSETFSDTSNIRRYINDVLYIELVATPFNFAVLRETHGDDWSCGTLNRTGGQQSQIFVIAAFFSIYYYNAYKKRHDGSNLIKFFLSVTLMLTTNCPTLLAVFILGGGILYLLQLNAKRAIGFALIMLLLLGAFQGVSEYSIPITTPENHLTITVQKLVHNESWFKYRFNKVVIYKNTFFDIPSKDFAFGLIGNGVGYYNSRAALICTGYYQESFNRFFKPSVSFYTKEYILDTLEKSYLYGGTDYGSVLSRPYSSVLATMGEMGYIGVILCLLTVAAFLRNRNLAVRTVMIEWLCFCLVENYFEYSKIIVIVYGIIYAATQIESANRLSYTMSSGLVRISYALCATSPQLPSEIERGNR